MLCSAFYPITFVSWPHHSNSMFASVIQAIMWVLLSVFVACTYAVLFALDFLPLWTGLCPCGVTSCLSGWVTLCVRELLDLRHE